jgi:hypothetical protein
MVGWPLPRSASVPRYFGRFRVDLQPPASDARKILLTLREMAFLA